MPDPQFEEMFGYSPMYTLYDFENNSSFFTISDNTVTNLMGYYDVSFITKENKLTYHLLFDEFFNMRTLDIIKNHKNFLNKDFLGVYVLCYYVIDRAIFVGHEPKSPNDESIEHLAGRFDFLDTISL